MDRTPGKRPMAGSGAGAVGRAGAGNPRQPVPAVRRKRHGTPAETPRHPGETPRHPGGSARRPPSRKATAAALKRAASRRETRRVAGRKCADHRPLGGNAAGQRPSGRDAPLAGQPAAERMRAAGRASVSRVVPLSGADEAVTGQADEPHRGPAGGAGRTDWPSHFQITSSEIANTCSQHRKRRLSIHLRASYPNEISCCR
jgi:hypothetical protein